MVRCSLKMVLVGMVALGFSTIAFASMHCPAAKQFSHAEKGAPWVFNGSRDDWPKFDQTSSQGSDLTELPPDAMGDVNIVSENGVTTIECDLGRSLVKQGIVDFDIINNNANVVLSNIHSNFKITKQGNNWGANCQFSLGSPETCSWK